MINATMKILIQCSLIKNMKHHLVIQNERQQAQNILH